MIALPAQRDPKGWLVAPALIFILALFIYPFAYGLMLSFNPMNGGGMWANYVTFFTDSSMWPTIIVTLKLAVPATIINVGVSVPVAFALRRTSPWQKFATTLLVVPVTLGTVLIADGMLTYFSPNGWFPQALQALHLYGDEVRLTHNYWGVLISLIVSGFPFAFLLTLSYVTGIDPTLARAAATLGANPWQQFRQIYLPLLLPGLTMTACLSFVQAFSVFPSAVLLGAPAGPTRVISIAASEAAFENYDYALASTIAIVMGFVQLLVVGGMLGARRFFYTGPVTGGKG
ncbi:MULTISPECIES: sugar ABC transporter permease [Caballeronia]|jgi:putative spermidine/putrescine transport system permease protein|uniref:ABC transporter permease n=1 Tax=Caballeronia zhejiangensis TaxID=871203 RepID=A0A656QMJ9_9BURK|nr:MULTISPECIES: sugar ABC transporter permease [Caballeronia]EKS66667.1 ABC-type sugar transport systems permease component [Burkholderia sp. SJ98]KDR30929.1 ABC transporter permease [Caballeronia zhejiangensis]MDR5790055.1 sugar ABC transporter permease [Caballeronia sp. LP003]